MQFSEAVAAATIGKPVTHNKRTGSLVMLGEVRLSLDQSCQAIGMQAVLRFPPQLVWVQLDGTTTPAEFTTEDYSAKWRLAGPVVEQAESQRESHSGIVRVPVEEAQEAARILEHYLDATNVQIFADGSHANVYCDSPKFERNHAGAGTKHYRVVVDEMSNSVSVHRAP